ncbi:MAG: Shikimate kinase [Methanonatronarchaeales archaeon]|nr:Shikimate kinase [Methanonatronarchaeales archaeon]
MRGRASACGASTVVNAISTWKGSAFAVDLRTEAEVALDDSGEVRGEVVDQPAGPDLIETAVGAVLEEFAPGRGAKVSTRSRVPPRSGMKSSSAAANAAVLATLSALGRTEVEPLTAVRIGVEAAVKCGVTVTGAFDDAAASFLGGLVFTDNDARSLLERREFGGEVLFYVPGDEAPSAVADVDRATLLSGLVEEAFAIARRGEISKALTLNGVLHCASLGFDPGPALLALEAGADAAGLSGTGPSFTALPGDRADGVLEAWSHLPGRVVETRADGEGARVEEV